VRPRLLDLGFALVAALIEFANVIDNGASPLGLGLTAFACAVLLARRRAPLVVLVVTLAAELGVDAAGDYPAGAPILVMLFTVADQLDGRISAAALVPTAIVLGVGDILSPVSAVAVWFVGAAVRMRRKDIEEDERLAVRREREAIARELHDVIAHSVSVMLVGVRGARDVLRTQPDVADETLAKVEASGEQSLAELRRALGLLRAPAADADLRPQPTLAQLDDLLAEASLPARLEVVGERRPLSCPPTGSSRRR
jgi:signal transduction histidine kinase